MKRLLSLSLLLLFLVPTMHQAFAWGNKGHRIVAQVAYDNLTCKARKQVDAVLGKRGMIYFSTWADEIKSDTIYPKSHTCHYQDLDGGLTDAQVVVMLSDYPKVGGDLFMAMDSIETVLRKNGACHDALAFYVHFYADRFCPMHVAHLDDKGGNGVKMKWFGQNTNLHSVWDGKLIDYKGFSYTEYAQYLHDQYSNMKKAILKMTDEETLLQTYHVTSEIYAYHATWNGNTYHYAYRWLEPMEWQLYTAGVKLAQALNRIYK